MDYRLAYVQPKYDNRTKKVVFRLSVDIDRSQRAEICLTISPKLSVHKKFDPDRLSERKVTEKNHTFYPEHILFVHNCTKLLPHSISFWQRMRVTRPLVNIPQFLRIQATIIRDKSCSHYITPYLKTRFSKKFSKI